MAFEVNGEYNGGCCVLGKMSKNDSWKRRILRCYDCPPIDDHRLKLKNGDRVIAWKAQNHWLYGSILLENGGKDHTHGWFPRSVVRRKIN